MMGTIALVLKSGGDFKIDHVKLLLPYLRPHNVVLLTDLPVENTDVIVYRLRHDLPGWWSKMELFSPEFNFGDLLYLDLDTLVRTIPNKYFETHKSMMLSDFFFPERPASGMMFILEQDKDKVWNTFDLFRETNMARAGSYGDQKFIGEVLPHCRWQDSFLNEIFSYKTHVVKDKLQGRHFKGGFNAKTANVICFHGTPRPWEIEERNSFFV